MSSGIKLHEDVVPSITDIRKNHLYSFVLYRIVNKKEIQVSHREPKDSMFYDPSDPSNLPPSYARLVAMCKELAAEGKACYIAYDLKYLYNGQPKEKVAMITWASDDLGINEKMIYSSSKEALKVKIDPSVMVQANDEDELSIEHVLSIANKQAR